MLQGEAVGLDDTTLVLVVLLVESACLETVWVLGV